MIPTAAVYPTVRNLSLRLSGGAEPRVRHLSGGVANPGFNSVTPGRQAIGMDELAVVYQLAGRQGGVVTREQALLAGMSASAIDWRVATSAWEVVARGRYRTFPMETKVDLLRSAVATLHTAVASHCSAGEMHELPMFSSDVVSVSVHSSTTHRFPGVRTFRTRDLEERHVMTMHGLPVTCLERTVVDLASQLTSAHLGSIVDDLVASDRTQWSAISEMTRVIARRGKPGIGRMRELLLDRLGPDRSMSRLESAGAALLESMGLSGFVVEYPIPWNPTHRFDVAFPEAKLAIEWDSRRWHMQANAFERDRKRDRDAVSNGWNVIRFTWEDVHRNPESVARTISESVAIAAA